MKILGFEIKFPWSFKRDQRKAPRVRTFEDLYVDFWSSANSVRGTGEGRDVSTGGVQFFSDRKLPPGTSVELTLRIPPGILDVQQIQTHAQVLRCQKGFREKQHRVACAFQGIDETTFQRLATLVVWLKEREQKYLFFRYNSGQ